VSATSGIWLFDNEVCRNPVVPQVCLSSSKLTNLYHFHFVVTSDSTTPWYVQSFCDGAENATENTVYCCNSVNSGVGAFLPLYQRARNSKQVVYPNRIIELVDPNQYQFGKYPIRGTISLELNRSKRHLLREM